MTDDVCIATALLHGATPEQGETGKWFNGLVGAYHAIERMNHAVVGRYGFDSAADLCRAYCKHHNLEG